MIKLIDETFVDYDSLHLHFITQSISPLNASVNNAHDAIVGASSIRL